MLELTAILDQNGIQIEKLIKRKSKQKYLNKSKDKKSNSIKNSLFGVSLDDLLQKDRERLDWNQRIPIILKIVSVFFLFLNNYQILVPKNIHNN